MRAEKAKPGAGAETATGSYCKAGELRNQDNENTPEIKFTVFFACDGGSVERLGPRGVTA